MRWALYGSEVLMLIAKAWRVYAVWRAKSASSVAAGAPKSCSALCSDPQILTLELLLLAAPFKTIALVDLQGVEAVFQPWQYGLMAGVYVILSVMTLTVGLRTFVLIHARFHPPSIRVARALRWTTIAYVLAFVVGGLLSDSLTHYETNLFADAVTLLLNALIFVGTWLYSVRTLRSIVNGPLAAQMVQRRER